VSDDLMSQLAALKPAAAPAPAFDPMATQKLPPNSDRTQKLTIESTQRIQPLEPAFKPEATQQLEPKAFSAEATQQLDFTAKPDTTQKLETQSSPETTQRIDTTQTLPVQPPPAEGSDAETTQRIDDSIWRLREAQRILAGLPQK
jgi:hypothetical protein